MAGAAIDWAARERAASDIALRAGDLALDYFARRATLTVDIKTRGRYDTVSEADREVEAFIRRELEAAFPDDAILGEEGGFAAGSTGCTWVVDPIDGTDCFVNGIPVWCVSIAAVADGRIELGVIRDPNHDELFVAAPGHRPGAFLNGAPIVPNDATEIDAGVVGVGINHRVPPGPTMGVMQRLLEAGGMYQRNGSGALMLAYVACGRLIGYYEEHINSWDALAGVALINAAGGWTNDFLADDGLTRGSVVIASNLALAPALRELCRFDG